MKIFHFLNVKGQRDKIVFFAFVLSLTYYQSFSQTVTLVAGNRCVGSTQTFSFNNPGNCNTVTWQVAPAGTYTIISQTKTVLNVRWNSATSVAKATAVYSVCSGGSSGQASSSNQTISAAVTPSVSIVVDGGSSTICAGQTLSFTATAVNGGSTPTYSWSVNGSVKQTGNGANSRFFSWSTFNNGEAVTCSIISVLSGCLTSTGATSNSIPITVNQPTSLTLVINSSGLPACSGQSGPTFTLTGSPPNGTYTWYKNNVVATDNTPGYPSFAYKPTTPLNAGDQIKLSVTPHGTCVVSSTSNTVTAFVTQPLTPAITVAVTSHTLPVSICSGTNLTFTASAASGGYSLSNYQWTFNGSPVAGNNTSTFSTTEFTSSSVVTVAATASGSCLTTTSVSPVTTSGFPISVTQRVTPGVALSPTTVNVCAGSNVSFTATPSNGGSSPSYAWQINGATAPGSMNSSTYSTTALQTGDVVRVIMTSSFSCLTGSASAEATSGSITATPYSSFSLNITNPGSLCEGKNGQFAADIIDGGNGTYQWYRTRAGVETLIPAGERDMSSGYAYIFVPAATAPLQQGDQIKCRFTSNRQCVTTNPITSNTVPVSVTNAVTPAITVAVTSHTLPVSICAGTNLTFTASAASGGYTLSNYQWTFNGTPVAGNSTNTFSTTSFTSSSIVTVAATAIGSCLSTTSVPAVTTSGFPITVIQHLTPSVSLSPTTVNACAGSNVSFTATPSNGGSSPSYVWQINGVTAPGSTNSNTYATTTLQTGDVVKVIMTSNFQCISGSASAQATSNSITITPYSTFTLNITNPGSLCEGKNGQFAADIIDGGNGTYQWYRTRGGVETLIPNGERDMSSGYAYIFVPATTAPLQQGDQIKSRFTSNRLCVTTNPVVSNTVSVSVTNPVTPAVTISLTSHALPITLCAGVNMSFLAGPPSGAGYTLTNYQWRIDGNLVSGNNTNTLSTTNYVNGTIITATATPSGTCLTPGAPTTGTTAGWPLNIIPFFSPEIAPSGTLKIASTAHQIITATPSSPEYSYTWLKDGIAIPDATDATYSASQNGTYKVLVKRDVCEKPSAGQLILTKNIAPVVNAGTDQVLDFRLSTSTLSGVASDADGTITQYEWTQTSGPSDATMSGSASPTLSLSNLIYGTYTFR